MCNICVFSYGNVYICIRVRAIIRCLNIQVEKSTLRTQVPLNRREKERESKKERKREGANNPALFFHVNVCAYV